MTAIAILSVVDFGILELSSLWFQAGGIAKSIPLLRRLRLARPSHQAADGTLLPGMTNPHALGQNNDSSLRSGVLTISVD